jgi:hypothetical protein
MEVRDAETGEWLVLASPNAKPQAFALHAAAPSPSPGKRLGASSSSSLLPPLAQSPSRKVVHPGVQAASNNAHTERVFVFPETLSTRPMGAKVNWQHDQEMRVEVRMVPAQPLLEMRRLTVDAPCSGLSIASKSPCVVCGPSCSAKTLTPRRVKQRRSESSRR